MEEYAGVALLSATALSLVARYTSEHSQTTGSGKHHVLEPRFHSISLTFSVQCIRSDTTFSNQSSPVPSTRLCGCGKYADRISTVLSDIFLDYLYSKCQVFSTIFKSESMNTGISISDERGCSERAPSRLYVEILCIGFLKALSACDVCRRRFVIYTPSVLALTTTSITPLSTVLPSGVPTTLPRTKPSSTHLSENLGEDVDVVKITIEPEHPDRAPILLVSGWLPSSSSSFSSSGVRGCKGIREKALYWH